VEKHRYIALRSELTYSLAYGALKARVVELWLLRYTNSSDVAISSLGNLSSNNSNFRTSTIVHPTTFSGGPTRYETATATVSTEDLPWGSRVGQSDTVFRFCVEFSPMTPGRVGLQRIAVRTGKYPYPEYQELAK
jgi:hypothetical protein